ncbi:Hypothetical protein I596_65 [Dokdonella koreensis DS-123]|uniref:DUF4398 domain-containing protein n=1 Tax=Dokdonella koreensis DS-123 TaxID=1300342 RepID=A0A167G356_9GAMM|nr:Hypothetical protein I596_65 [Dokdonella koreensis DS-123]
MGICLLAACSPTRPPGDLFAGANRNLAAARQAGAQTYAPLELRFAEERLAQAQAANAREDYPVAVRLARESEANGELATVKARLGKARETADTLRQQNAALQRDLDTRGGEVRR